MSTTYHPMPSANAKKAGTITKRGSTRSSSRPTRGEQKITMTAIGIIRSAHPMGETPRESCRKNM